MDGAGMGTVGGLDQRTYQALDAISETSYQLVVKAKSALKRGDFEAAERLLFAAKQKGPTAADMRDIESAMGTVQDLRLEHFRGVVQFDHRGPDSAQIVKFVKSPDRVITVEIPERLRNHPEMQRLVREETEAYGKFTAAQEKLQRTQDSKEMGRATEQEYNKAIEEYSGAIDKVAEKRNEIVKKVYELVN
jgi:hypothetical protein